MKKIFGTTNMNWTKLESTDHLEEAIEESHNQPILIFKHSASCSISALSLNRLERAWNLNEAKVYFLDLIRYRNVSNKIAELFEVHHQSPQVLVISKGKSIYDESHMGISYQQVEGYLQKEGV